MCSEKTVGAGTYHTYHSYYSCPVSSVDWVVTITQWCDGWLGSLRSEMSAEHMSRVTIMRRWWRGRSSRARCLANVITLWFIIIGHQCSVPPCNHNYYHINGYWYYIYPYYITHTNGLGFCPINNLICQIVVKSKIILTGDLEEKKTIEEQMNWTDQSYFMVMMGLYFVMVIMS